MFSLPSCFNITPEDFRDWRSPWYDAEVVRRHGDPVLVGQELDIEYLASGSPRFSSELLEAAKATIREPARRVRVVFSGDKVIFADDPAGELCIYHEPEPGHSYVIGGDPASGHANALGGKAAPSKTGLVVLDSSDYPKSNRVAAAFSFSQLDPGWMARLMGHLATYYHRALVVPEINGPGVALLTTLLGSGHEKPIYTHIYRQKRSGPDEKGNYFRLGWNNSPATRPLMERAIAVFLAHTAVNDSRIVGELNTYVWTVSGKDVRGEAAPGEHDDLVISLGLALIGAAVWFGRRDAIAAEKDTFDAMVEQYRNGLMTAEDVINRFTHDPRNQQ